MATYSEIQIGWFNKPNAREDAVYIRDLLMNHFGGTGYNERDHYIYVYYNERREAIKQVRLAWTYIRKNRYTDRTDGMYSDKSGFAFRDAYAGVRRSF